jgi:hypothetical protein
MFGPRKIWQPWFESKSNGSSLGTTRQNSSKVAPRDENAAEATAHSQGCQIFLDTLHIPKYTKLTLNYQMAMYQVYQIVEIYSKWL